MKFNTFGWIGIIAGGLGGLIGMTAAIIAAPVEGSIFAVIFIAIFGGVFWKFLFKPMIISRRLEKIGVTATAKILEVNDTGVTVNNNPQIKMLLEVNSNVSGTYLVESKQVISRLQIPMFQPGATIPVLIDPNNKNLVSLDYRENNLSAFQNTNTVVTGPWSGISAEEAQRRLIELDNKNKEILSVGKSCRAIVTKYTWLGIYVNGNNPAVELNVEVLPDDRPAFRAAVYGVIKVENTGKFQVGEEIYVKYDQNDINRVTIEHS